MQHLTAYQVASIRILSAGIVLLPFAIKGFKQVPKNKIGAIIIAGLLGNFFPAYLYCLAEIKIRVIRKQRTVDRAFLQAGEYLFCLFSFLRGWRHG